MRFKTLGLDRYGCFTDRRLAFGDARLTVILGANEAGKTTALAAVADALFGIEERSRFNFLHDYKAMRLTATVAGGDGRELSFTRLKRRAAALVDPVSEAPLADDCLAPFLGAHDRRAFLDIFGLDQARLREGGRKLLAGGGDLADTLFAAAPGLSRIAALRERFREAAAQTFNPGRRTASNAFYRALDKRAAAQRRVRETELKVDEVRAEREEAERAAQARAVAVAAEIEAGLALRRAQAFARAAKELRIIDAEQAVLDRQGALPQLATGFCEETQRLLAALATAGETCARAAGEEADAAAACAAIAVDDAILAVAAPIAALDEERAAVEKEVKSLSNRRTEAAEAGARLDAIAKGLGLAEVAALRARLPGPPLLARAERLVGRLAATAALAETLASDRAKLAEEHRKAAAARAGLGHVADPTPARRRLDALDGAEERERALRLADHRLAAGRDALAERVGRLGLGTADAAALAAIALPATAAAEAALRAVRAAEEIVSRQTDSLRQLEDQLAQATARLAVLTGGRPMPTEAAIAAARRSRDQLWMQVRPLALGERAAAAADRDAARDLDHAMLDADRLADERQTETQRLAELAQAELKIADLGVQLDAAQRRLKEAGARLAATGAAWRTLWAGGPVLPADDAALAVLREAQAVLAARETLRQDAAAAEAAREAVRWDRAEAERLRAELGLAALGEAPLRMADLRAAVEALERRFRDAREHERDLKLLEARAADVTTRERDLADQQQAAAAEAADLFPRLAVRADAAAEEARAALDLWREAPALATALATAEHRIDGIERDKAAFAARVDDLVAQTGGRQADEDGFAAVRRLKARLEMAKQARAKADAAAEALAARRGALIAAEAARTRAESAVAAVVAQAGLDRPEALPPLIERLAAAAAATRRLTEARARLAEDAGDRGEDELRTAVAGHDDEALARRAAEADAAHAAARAARDQAIEHDTRARGALDALEQREGATRAAQEEQDAVAEIAAAVERFTRDHVAARLLSVAMDRYRERHQSPIVERASRLFAALTDGHWSGIGVDYDADPPRLATLRQGRPVAVEALSEGTADQLFLALRIAAIEEHARRATPLPFIADDLFVSFDERRTECGLRALSELGALTQVIVFTHHEHVAGCAERALPGEVAIVRL
ncbi:ATP-binding protein [Blastochloris viridis]|uniref:DNA double-strand break repair Rad50 ATPase n=1 Tax=Blastochloris viridis TaxID=1079 RepID=A0A0H5BEC4_BLAVI|nr:YhaN family protein [Blastochloris viridis]ALK08034.1 hypothetical protein BVIR_218 [Blastochloris viridis]BAR98706.1 DNA double-strand break repair Rad50 ATPase [Blastochloris viridis]CUU43956.1 hypothetical protein BVIRIDIS_29840 [Blastochloris viridis]